MDPKYICVVTIHGVGFMQPPINGIPGYADGLHQHLSKYLDEHLLGDDPKRQRNQRGQNGPIYVQSYWPPGSSSTEPALARLGAWGNERAKIIDISRAPLGEGKARIVHIALVYSRLEGFEPQVGPLLQTTASAILSLGHYAHVLGITRLLFSDIRAALGNKPQQESDEEIPSLRVRTDSTTDQDMNAPPTGLLGTIRQLENDVAVYVCHNDRRERVRNFVWEAILRLAYREDVAGIVINAHSNGTVISFDFLRDLPPDIAEKVLAFITAGSPLRKYVDLFHWGNEVGNIQKIKQWKNFWDPQDPVADPLVPPVGWLRGAQAPPSDQLGLYQFISRDTGAIERVPIQDIQIDNVKNSIGGGLQAHNYWDNEPEFVQPLAEILKDLVSEKFGQEDEKAG
jgi:hypothetical protein